MARKQDAAERKALLRAARSFDPPEPDHEALVTVKPAKGPKQAELEERRRRKRAEALGQQQQATPGVKPDPDHGQQEEKRLPRFVFITDDELEAMDIPPMQWIADGLIPKVLVSAIVAQSGAGKTWIALDLARACSTGGLFLGQYPALRCRVGIVDAEDEYVGLQTRWKQLQAGMGRLPDDRIKVRMLSGIGSFDVMNPEDHEPLAEAMRCLDLIIIDSLAQSHNRKESENSEMKPVMQQWEDLSRRTGCTVLLIAHAGWAAGDRVRGGSVIRDRVQAELNLTKDGDGAITRIGQAKNKFDACRPNVATVRFDGNRNTPMKLVFGEAAIEPTDQQREQVRRFVLDQLRGVEMLQTDLVDSIVERRIAGRTTAHAVILAMAEQDGTIIRAKAGRSVLCKLA